MFDYEILLTAWKLKHGKQTEDATTPAELDELYGLMGGQMKDNPGAWQ